MEDPTYGRRIGVGNTAEIFEAEGNRVLKLFREGMPEAPCRYEMEATRDIHAYIGGCPDAYGLVMVGNRLGILMERISGPSMMREMLRHILRYRSWAYRLAQCHIALQQPVTFPMRTAKGMLSERIALVSQLSVREKEFLRGYLDVLPDGDRLCHFDFHPDNVMMAASGPVVIDWMNACKGDPLADVARTMMLLEHSFIPNKSAFVKRIIIAMRLRVCSTYTHEYLRLSGANIEDVERWALPVMAARLYERIPDEEKQRLMTFIRQRIAKAQ